MPRHGDQEEVLQGRRARYQLTLTLTSPHLSPVTPDSCIYALGGFDSTNYQSTVERLDPRMGKWLSVPRWNSMEMVQVVVVSRSAVVVKVVVVVTPAPPA